MPTLPQRGLFRQRVRYAVGEQLSDLDRTDTQPLHSRQYLPRPPPHLPRGSTSPGAAERRGFGAEVTEIIIFVRAGGGSASGPRALSAWSCAFGGWSERAGRSLAAVAGPPEDNGT